MAQWIECWLYKREDQSSDPQHQSKCWVGVAVSLGSQCWWHGVRGSVEQAARLAGIGNSSFMYRSVKEETWRQLLASTNVCTHTHTLVPPPHAPHTCECTYIVQSRPTRTQTKMKLRQGKGKSIKMEEWLSWVGPHIISSLFSLPFFLFYEK